MRILNNLLIAATILSFGTSTPQSTFAQSTSQTSDTPSYAVPGAPTPDFSQYTPHIQAMRITSDLAPKIDGELSDPVWQKAHIIDRFYQQDPVLGGEPSEPTKAYILYDEDYLYVAVHAFDSEPSSINASQMRRDPRLNKDDGIRIILDPFNTTRDGFFFGMNANGARLDALTENNSKFIGNWNTLWHGDATVTKDGWVAEFAIPFRSISYDPAVDHWGLQIVRTIRRKNESIRWSNIDRTRGRTDLTQTGKLSGITEINQGRGIEAQLFATGLYARQHRNQSTDPDLIQSGDESLTFRPSANLFYKFNPSLTGTLTLNTDFSDTPLDNRQVNTGRFSLFFPETRDFFLQDAAVFEFGGSNFRRPNGLPFFSRRIGIVDGLPADILAGAKVSGKVGALSVGGLIAQTDQVNEFEGQTLSALRISAPILAESKIGFTLTGGDPSGETNNTVGGIDFQYKNTSLIEGATLGADFAFVNSTDSDASGNLYSTFLTYNSDRWGFDFRSKRIEEDYNPRLGFVNRADLQDAVISGRRRFRPQDSWIRFVNVGAFSGINQTLNGDTLDEFTGIFMSGQNNNGGRFFAEIETISTQIDDSLNDTDPSDGIQTGFNLAGIVNVPAATYEYTAIRGEISTSNGNPLSVELFAQYNDIYNGSQTLLSPELSWRPSKYFELALDYTYNNFDLPAGAVTIHTGSIEADFNFTPDMTISTEMQYDNISENYSFFGRYKWERRPGQTVSIALNHGAYFAEADFPGTYDPLSTSLSIRFGQTLRY